MKTKAILTAAMLGSALLAGCATPGVGGSDYARYQVRGEQSVRLATVVGVRPVNIQGTHSGAGGLAGALIGGIAGNSVGRGNGNGVATVAGAVVGAVAGSAIEQNATSQTGVEVTVQFDNGRLSAITQGADEAFRVGDRVMVTAGAGATRVTHVAAGSALSVPPPPPGSAPAPASMVPPPGSAPAPASYQVPPPGSAPAPASQAAPTAAVAAGGGRWYCPEQGYYPEVATCTQQWVKVAN